MQIFDADDVVVFDDFGRDFLQVIRSGIADLFMDPGDFDALFLVIFRFGQFSSVLFDLLSPPGKDFLFLDELRF